MPFILKENLQIYYEVYGSGFPIILTYGLGGSTKLWDKQKNDLSLNHKLILWDQRGEGYSSCPLRTEEYRIENSVEDLLDLMNYLNIDKACIGGQSLGGGVAIRFALKYPQRTMCLVVCNSHSASGLPSSIEMRSVRDRTLEMFNAEEDFCKIAEYLINNEPNLVSRFLPNGGDSNKLIWNQITEMFSIVNPIAYMKMIMAMKLQDDISNKLHCLKMPVLLITGDRDPSRNSMEYMVGKLQNCMIKIVSNAGHHANIDNSVEFNLEFLRFLELF